MAVEMDVAFLFKVNLMQINRAPNNPHKIYLPKKGDFGI